MAFFHYIRIGLIINKNHNINWLRRYRAVGYKEDDNTVFIIITLFDEICGNSYSTVFEPWTLGSWVEQRRVTKKCRLCHQSSVKKFCPQNRLKNFCIPLIQYNLDNIYLIEGTLFFKRIWFSFLFCFFCSKRDLKWLNLKIRITETSYCFSYRNETIKTVKIRKLFL